MTTFNPPIAANGRLIFSQNINNMLQGFETESHRTKRPVHVVSE